MRQIIKKIELLHARTHPWRWKYFKGTDVRFVYRTLSHRKVYLLEYYHSNINESINNVNKY